jgi:hypothetical protein
MRDFWLSIHLPYRCRHAGACCSSGWAIPIEVAPAAMVQWAVDNRQLTAPLNWVSRVPDQPAEVAGILAVTDEGRCVFRQAERCRIHTALGASSLPTACRHFPRQCLIDPRGVSVTLSHYCPTAADLLFTHKGPVEIVEGPEPVPGGLLEGLDAREALPPLLTSGVLMDHDGYAAWESHVVGWLGRAANPDGEVPPELVLHALDAHARALSSWRPGSTSLADAVRGLSHEHVGTGIVEPDWAEERRLVDIARSAVPAQHRSEAQPAIAAPEWDTHAARWWSRQAVVINRYLAAHAFASWMAYQGGGVRAFVRRLRLALAVLRAEVQSSYRTKHDLTNPTLREAIRRADLLIVHHADQQDLASRLSR